MGKKTRQRRKTRRRHRKTRKRGGNRPTTRKLTDEQKEIVKNLTPDQRKMLLSCYVYLKKWNKLYKTKKYKFEKPDNIYNMIIKFFQI